METEHFTEAKPNKMNFKSRKIQKSNILRTNTLQQKITNKNHKNDLIYQKTKKQKQKPFQTVLLQFPKTQTLAGKN